jgi:hypothetical protein
MLRKFIAGVTILPLLLTVLVVAGCEKKSEQPAAGGAVEQRIPRRGGPAMRERIQERQQETGTTEETE